MDGKTRVFFEAVLVPFNAGMLIVPVYSFSQLIYYCSGDVILKPEGCGPMLQR